MKNLFACFAALMFSAGCMGPKHVEFVYFNLSGNEIQIVNIVGMPPNVTPGNLAPVHGENNSLDEASATFFEAIPVADRLKIIWQEAGVSRELELKREDLGLPSKLENAKVRFTYLGNEKWRITRLK